MLGRADGVGSGRVRLPAAYIGVTSLAYGQPILVEVQLDGGQRASFLCSASAAAGPSSEDGVAVIFDPSVRRGVHAGSALPCGPDAPALPVTLHPVAAKVVTATSLKVCVPASLLGSPLPAARLQQRLVQRQCTVFLSSSVHVHVLEVLPVAAPAAVYRVVPSTIVQLVSRDSSSSNSSDSGAAGQGASSPAARGTAVARASASKSPATPEAAGAAASITSSSSSSSSRIAGGSGGSSSASKTPRSKTASGTPGAPARRGSSRAAGSEGGAGGSSSSSCSKPKQKKAPKTDEGSGAIAASSSMFDVLNALGDD